MAKENGRDSSDLVRPLPHCKALLLCEKVTESLITGRTTIHNLIETFSLRAFPGRSTQVAMFLQVYDGIGRYGLRVELTNLSDGSIIAESDLDDLVFPARLARIQAMVTFDFVPLPRPGRYELTVFVDEQPLASQHFDAEIDNGSE